MTTFTDPTAAHVRLIQVEAERWPVHLATGQGWCGPGRLVLGPTGGDLHLALESWDAGLAPGQKVLLVARSWDSSIACFTTVQSCTEDGQVIVAWPRSLDMDWAVAHRRPECVSAPARRAA